MTTAFKNTFAATVGIGVPTDVAAMAAGEQGVVKQIKLTHPGAGRGPSLAGSRAACPGPNGSLFAVVGYCIVKISKDTTGGDNVSLIAGLPNAAGSSNGVGTLARFGAVIGGLVYHAPTDSLYVSDTSNNKIRRVLLSSNTVSDFAGSAAGTAGIADGTGSGATFNAPQAIATDGTNLYVGQGAFSSPVGLRKIVIATAVVTTCSGTTVGNTTTHIEGVSVDKDGAAGFVWFTTRDGAGVIQLRRYSITGNSAATVASNGGGSTVSDFLGDYGSASALGLATSGSTNICTVICDPLDASVAYVTNRNGAYIRRVRLVGGSLAAPVSVQIYSWCGSTSSPQVQAEGASQSAQFLNSLCLVGATSGGVLLAVESLSGCLWAIDIASVTARFVILGAGGVGLIDTCDSTAGFSLTAGTSTNGNVHATGGVLKAQSYGTATNGNYKGPDATLVLPIPVGDFSATFAIAWNNVNAVEMGRFAIDFMDASNNVLWSYSVQDGGNGTTSAGADIYTGTNAVTLTGNTGGLGVGVTLNSFDGLLTISRSGLSVSYSGGGLNAGSSNITATAVAKIRFRFEAYGLSGAPSPFTLLELKEVQVYASGLTSAFLAHGHSAGNHDVWVTLAVRKAADGATNKHDQAFARNVQVPLGGLPVYIEEAQSLEGGDELVVTALNGPVRVDVSLLSITP